jgi:two-component system, response regulator YesN
MRNSLFNLKTFPAQGLKLERSDVTIKMAILLIEQQYSRPDLSLDKLAVQLFISKWHLSKLFKQKVGIGSKEYLRKVRLERAQELLKDGSLSIKEVALAVGYYYATNFSTDFKSLYGVKPGDYRLNWLWDNRTNFKKAVP